MLPNLNKLYSKGSVDVLAFNHTGHAFDGLFCQMGSFKGIEEVDVKIFGGFKVVEDAVEEDKSGCRVRR